MKTLLLLSCVLMVGAAGCGRANCAEFAKAYCDRATNTCGVPCSVSELESACKTVWGSECDMSPCITDVNNASCTDPTFSCVAKCPR